MNRSIGSSVLCVGAATALALAGCTHHEQPAKQATSSPTFESNVGPAEQGQPGAGPSGQYGAAPQAPSPQGAQPVSPGAGGPAATPGAGQPSAEQPAPGPEAAAAPAPPAAINEQELCTSLARDATLHVEDVPGGAAINIKPRSSADLEAVRRRAQQVQQHLEQSGRSTPSGAACELFTMVRTGAASAITEAPDRVRILITTPDENRVRTIRKQTRDFVNAMEKSSEGGQKKKSGEGGHEGTHR